MRWRIGRTRIRHVGGSPAAWWGMSAREAPPPIHLVHAQGGSFKRAVHAGAAALIEASEPVAALEEAMQEAAEEAPATRVRTQAAVVVTPPTVRAASAATVEAQHEHAALEPMAALRAMGEVHSHEATWAAELQEAAAEATPTEAAEAHTRALRLAASSAEADASVAKAAEEAAAAAIAATVFAEAQAAMELKAEEEAGAAQAGKVAAEEAEAMAAAVAALAEAEAAAQAAAEAEAYAAAEEKAAADAVDAATPVRMLRAMGSVQAEAAWAAVEGDFSTPGEATHAHTRALLLSAAQLAVVASDDVPSDAHHAEAEVPSVLEERAASQAQSAPEPAEAAAAEPIEEVKQAVPSEPVVEQVIALAPLPFAPVQLRVVQQEQLSWTPARLPPGLRLDAAQLAAAAAAEGMQQRLSTATIRIDVLRQVSGREGAPS
jgi:hypothetical protein